MNTSIGVIIVNWNSFDCLERCLLAIKNQSCQPTRVVVIDNNSDNAPLSLSCETPDNTIYIKLDENTGFARANNMAVSHIGDCQWIVLVNPDAFLDPNCLLNLISASQRQPEYSCFACQTIMANQLEYLDGTGDVYHISGIGWRRGYGRHIASSIIVEEEVFAPCAAAAMYRREAWEEARGFDEDYFCYFEDVDLAFRLRLMGYRCLFVPSALAYHVGSVTSGGHQSDFSVYYGHRNLVWTYIKDMPGYAFWLYLPLHIAMNIAAIILFTYEGRWQVILRAKWDAVKGIKSIWCKRRAVQAKRIIPISEITRFMDKRILPVRRHGKRLKGKSSDILSIVSGHETINPALVNLNDKEDYFNYLRRRSLSGHLYRKYWLYPKLKRHLYGRILDIGCGIGDFLAFHPDTVGVDVNAFAVDWCKKRGLDARLMRVDSLPFEDSSFECVVLDNVLEHLVEPHRLLSEIRRVMVSGGRLLVGVPGSHGYTCDQDHKVFYEEGKLEDTMRDANFTKSMVFYTPFKSDWLDKHLPQYCLYAVFMRD
ncbi:MAG: glycosyltransferase [Gammaproteobacteria bacterium]|nr:glycosyltransferase [Gammaproteobacteria bacterium]